MIRRVLAALLLAACMAVADPLPFSDVTVDGTSLQPTALVNELLQSVMARQGDAIWNRDREDGYIIHETRASPDYQGAISLMQRSLLLDLSFSDMYWVRTNLLGSAFTADTLPVYTNLVDVFLDAGMSSNGWRRATSYDPAGDVWTDIDDPLWEREGNGFGVF